MRELLKLIFNKRFRQIVALFIQFTVQFWWLGKKRKFFSQEQMDIKYRLLYKRQAEKFTATAIDLGGLLIKLGQFFSSRVDILPKEYTDELSKLQDAVRPVDTSIICERIEQELAAPVDKLFAVFSTQPVAAASLGQVHWARLQDGEEVAVKVLRPGIEEIVAIDLEALRLVIAFAKRYRRVRNLVDLDQVYYEFRDTVSDELDYFKEAHNAEKFREMFSDDKRLYIPRIYWQYTAKRVLTMEYIRGVKINDFNALDKEGINKSELAQVLLSVFLRQVLEEGFFHADPHPGNILIRNDGTMVLLDFGMVGRVDKIMKENFIDLAVGIFKKDASSIIDAFDRLGFLRPQADRTIMLKSVRLMLANLFGDAAVLGKIDFNELSMELRELVYSQPFQLPAQTTFLGKALITVFGLCNGLDDDFQLLQAVNPYIEEVFGPDAGVDARSMLYDQGKKTLLEVIKMPAKINRFIDGVESGEIRVHPSRSFEQKILEQQVYLTNKIVFAVLAAGFVIAGSELLRTFYEPGLALMGFGSVSALMLLRGGHRTGRSRARGMRNMGSGFRKPKFHP